MVGPSLRVELSSYGESPVRARSLIAALKQIAIFSLFALASCGGPVALEVMELREELADLLQAQESQDEADGASYRERSEREDRISVIRARLRFHEEVGRLPSEDDNLEEFDAKLVMRALEELLSDAIARIEVFRADHGRYPSSLSEAGIDLTGKEVDLGFEPLFGSRGPSVQYWPGFKEEGYVFGVRMRCSAWFGHMPNMWTLDFLTSATELGTHPEREGFEKWYTEGRWAVWY